MRQRRNDGFYVPFGKLVRAYRKSTELTQEEVGQAIGVNRTHVCNIETGRSGVGLEMAVKLAKVLGIKVTALIPGSPPPELTLTERVMRLEALLTSPEGGAR